MKKIILTLAIVAVINLRLTAADAKDYQVTGPILEVNASYIVVQKGDQKWQIAVDSSTKGDKPKVGDKVTIHYTMTATEIVTKPAKK
jgi:FKBP-type peptidyl-prolyl cis-trans isomerase